MLVFNITIIYTKIYYFLYVNAILFEAFKSDSGLSFPSLWTPLALPALPMYLTQRKLQMSLCWKKPRLLILTHFEFAFTCFFNFKCYHLLESYCQLILRVHTCSAYMLIDIKLDVTNFYILYTTFVRQLECNSYNLLIIA